MPPRAVGSTTPRTVRQRLTPSASAASRRPVGTSSSTSCVARAISGSMMIASANGAGEAALVVADDEQPEDEQADDDRRQSVQQVERQPDRARRPGPGELGQIERGQDPRSACAIAVASATITAVPTIAGAIPPPGYPERRRVLRQEADAQRARAA